MKLYVVRHGQTEENVTSIMQGHTDTVLNDTGIKQAEETKKLIQNKEIGLIISSPLKRAYKTAQILSDGKIEIVIDDRLIGRNYGEFTGKPRQEIDMYSCWNYNLNTQYKEAECVRDLFKRITSFMEDIKRENKSVLLVTHGGVCRVLYYYFNGIPADGDLTGYKAVNARLEEYELEENK